MLSPKEQLLLDGMEKSLLLEDPRLVRKFTGSDPARRMQNRAEMRVLLLVGLGAVVLSLGIASAYFDALIGVPLAALGGGLLVWAVRSARGVAAPPAWVHH